MMDCDDKKSSGVVCAVARRAGAAAGTSIAAGKRIADYGGKTVSVTTGWLKWPFKALMEAGNGKREARAGNGESVPEEETSRKKAAKALIIAAESAAVTAQPELKSVESSHGKTPFEPPPPPQPVETRAKEDSLISVPKQTVSKTNDESVLEPALKTEESGKTQKAEAATVAERVQLVIEPPVEQAVEKPRAEVQEEPSREIRTTEMPSLARMMSAEALAAVFPDFTDKIIFTKAFSELASQNETVRAGAVKTLSAVRHELSVRILVSQIASEPSAHVRCECVKALTTMDMEGALAAVEHALTDEAALVRLAAVWGIYHLTKAESAHALIGMFADEDEEVRRRAVTCLGWLGKEEYAVELLPLLDDSSVSVRLAAVKAMGNLGNRKVVSSLIDQLNDPVESIRKAVLTAIETIIGKRIGNSFPRDKKEFEILVARWQVWWKEELLG